MTDYHASTNTSTSLPEIVLRPGHSTRDEVDDELRRAARQALDATLPRDVRHRYSLVKDEKSADLKRIAGEIRNTLDSADVGAVLSGKVAEKVKEGIAELSSHNDYTEAVNSIT